MGPLMKAKKLKKDGDKLVRTVESIEDETQSLLLRIRTAGGAADAMSDDVSKTFRKRQLIARVMRDVGSSILSILMV